jgi:ferritin|tara:strand:+ start:264 stop:647 length:384 start_codon:yes stop_codon:yes gene_type:complete
MRKIMNNPPSKEELITSIIKFLEDDVIHELKGQKRFHAHVAKNSLSVILREIQLEESNNKSEKERLEKILRTNDSIKKMNKLLCQNIDNEQIDISDNHLIDHLFKTTMEKLSIDQPSYSSFLAEKEK